MMGCLNIVKKKTQKKSNNKVNKLVFEVYKKSINKKMECGKDPSLLINRLNYLSSKIKK